MLVGITLVSLVVLSAWSTQVERPVDLDGVLGESAWILGAFFCVAIVIKDSVSDGDTAALELSLTSICVRKGCVHPPLMCVLVFKSPPILHTHLTLIPSSSQPPHDQST